MFRSRHQVEPCPEGSGSRSNGFPAVDEVAERVQIVADVETDKSSGLPTHYSPRDKPPLREQQVAARHSAHQRKIGAWAATSNRELEEVGALADEAVTTAERMADGVEHRVAALDRELDEADEKVKTHDAARRFEKLPPTLLYALPLLVAIADFPYTSQAFAFITDSSSGEKFAIGALAGQVVAYHFLGSLLKDLAVTPMNRSTRRATMALAGALALGAAIFGAGIVAVRAASGSGGGVDAVTFAGLQLIFAVAATTVAFVVHSPLVASRRQIAKELASERRRLGKANDALVLAQQNCADVKAAIDTIGAVVAERAVGAQHAFEDLALHSRRLAQASFAAFDGNSDRAELLEHFPLPQTVIPVRDDDLGHC